MHSYYTQAALCDYQIWKCSKGLPINHCTPLSHEMAHKGSHSLYNTVWLYYLVLLCIDQKSNKFPANVLAL